MAILEGSTERIALPQNNKHPAVRRDRTLFMLIPGLTSSNKRQMGMSTIGKEQPEVGDCDGIF